ncbi:MAG: FIST signal transduction protein [Bacteroidia bacterium]
MKNKQLLFTLNTGWKEVSSSGEINNANLVFIFGSSALVKEGNAIDELIQKFPSAIFIGGSTSGEIAGTSVNDHSVVATVIEFDKTTIKYASEKIDKAENSYEVGKALVQQLLSEKLKHIFVISEGLVINGSELVRGLRDQLPAHIAATGGLAGDGADFKETFVLNKNGKAETQLISAIGFYGDSIEFGYASLGGWDSFGVERLVTKSTNNVLYELDGKPALDLYKSFLGEHAASLPASGLLFPLNMRIGKDSLPIVRTILAVNEDEKSLTFAGDIPEGAYVRLMKANFDRLIDGAVGAAKSTLIEEPELAILISCVGRKLVLKQMIEEEVEGVADILGNKTTYCGFYSYGEISPFSLGASCELHNQTMTITTMKEK